MPTVLGGWREGRHTPTREQTSRCLLAGLTWKLEMWDFRHRHMRDDQFQKFFYSLDDSCGSGLWCVRRNLETATTTNLAFFFLSKQVGYPTILPHYWYEAWYLPLSRYIYISNEVALARWRKRKKSKQMNHFLEIYLLMLGCCTLPIRRYSEITNVFWKEHKETR